MVWAIKRIGEPPLAGCCRFALRALNAVVPPDDPGFLAGIYNFLAYENYETIIKTANFTNYMKFTTCNFNKNN
jgi:hypothetical protein